MGRPRSYPYGADIGSRHMSFAAGDVSLNFVNAREYRRAAEPQEFLHGYHDLLILCRRINLFSVPQIDHLATLSDAHLRKAGTSFRRAIELREAIHRTMSAVIGANHPASVDLALLNARGRKAATRSEIAYEDGTWMRWWSLTENDLDAVWWPLATAAVELLSSNRLHLLKAYQGSDCGWLFLDHSRNRNRVWCTMKACGNRRKAAKHYASRRPI